MIKLIINNNLENHYWYYNDYIENDRDYLLEEVIYCDFEKIKDGRIYEFNNLKEVKEFIDSCEINFTEDYRKNFYEWEYWEKIDVILDISNDEDNLLIYTIDVNGEYID